jgi:uncharacterized membrane protein
MHPLFKFLHLASVVLWVGGMFFAYVCLRPVAASQLQPPPRLSLWAAVFARFFPWVWVAVALILLTGLSTLLAIGFAAAPLYWHLMLALGLLMSAIFAFVYFRPYGALRTAVAKQDWPAGGAALGSIRRWVGINLSLGVLTVLVATAGRLL